MLERTEIEQIEAKLSEHGKPVAELCREAGIAETTWGRWKRGDFHPSYAKAKAVREALSRIAGASAEQGVADVQEGNAA